MPLHYRRDPVVESWYVRPEQVWHLPSSRVVLEGEGGVTPHPPPSSTPHPPRGYYGSGMSGSTGGGVNQRGVVLRSHGC